MSPHHVSVPARTFGRKVAISAATAAAVALLTWAMVRFDGLVIFRSEWQVPYLVLCVAAAVLGGRIAGLTALAGSGLAIFVYGTEPLGGLPLANPAALAEGIVFVGVTGVVFLLTESRAHALTQVAAREQLRRDEDRMRDALEALMDPVAILEAVRDAGRIVDYRYLYVNSAAASQAGDQACHLIGRLLSEVVPDLPAASRAALDRVVESGVPEVRNGATVSVDADSERRHDVRIVRLGDGILLTHRDVTDQYLAAERLRRSERMYRILAEFTNDAVFLIRLDSVTWASPSAERVLGWAPQEIIGRPWSEFLVPEDIEGLTALYPRVAAGERTQGRARYRSRDGSIHWARMSFAPLYDDDGEYHGIIVSGQVIDDEVAAEDALRESQRQRARLIEQLPVGVFRARLRGDDTLVMEYASPQASELFRKPAGEPLEAAEMLRAIGPADFHWVRSQARDAATTGKPMVWEGPLPDVDPPVWLRVQGRVDVSGDDLVMDGLVADITQAREYEAALAREAESAARRAALLTEVDRTKSALLAALGHDLRTPLAVIGSAAAALRTTTTLSAEERDELLAHIQTNSDSLNHLLINLLDMSRVEAGAVPVQLGPVDLFEALEEPLRHTQDIRLELPADLPCVEADLAMLERVLDNLLRNAHRHRRPGTAITIAAAPSGDVVRVQVIDHGPGVPEERYDDMFVPFQRLDDTGVEGIGLGLSIARAFTQAMGGTLTPSATPGGGLTMTIELKGCHATSSPR